MLKRILDLGLCLLLIPILLVELVVLLLLSFPISFFRKKEKSILFFTRMGMNFRKKIEEHSILIYDDPRFKKYIILSLGGSNIHKKERIGKTLDVEYWPYPDLTLFLNKLGLIFIGSLSWVAILIPKLIYYIHTEKFSVIRSVEPTFIGIICVFLKYSTGVKMQQDIRANFPFLAQKNGPMLLFQNKKFINTPIAKLLYQIEKFARDISYSHSDAIITFNKETKERISKEHPNKKIYISRINVNPEFEKAYDSRKYKRKLGFKESEKIVLFCSRLSKEKFVMDAIMSFKEFLYVNENEKVRLIVIGEGELKNKMINYTKENKFQNKVIFTGSLPNEKVLEYVRAADIYLATFAGTAISEAALAGKAIVAYDYQSHNYLIKNNNSGIIVPFGDKKAMARGIERYAKNPKIINEFGKKVRKDALSILKMETIQNEEYKIYKSTIN